MHGVHTVKIRVRRSRPSDGWVSNAQLAQEIDQAHRRWLDRRALHSTVKVTIRRGAPKCPKVGAAIAEWRAMGRPERGFAEICQRHGARYGTAILRRRREEKGFKA